MYSRATRVEKVGLVVVRPLACGDAATVAAVAAGNAQRAVFDGGRDTLVAYVGDDAVAIARLVRDPTESARGEIALAVADAYDGCGVGEALVELLRDDARAARITRLTLPPREARDTGSRRRRRLRLPSLRPVALASVPMTFRR